ncbi:uncharacterized protein LOC21394511 isoform X2 [Morus notabilis]|uniref:uncharacterized protein LOC21394511 isoform X2 n=1 Tax=Morus notabilis TaxID=981085 RepID=UPI000CED5E6B|nr:uncharacterized protein LOC21394511 isoform X2 [Morus notabilis]
MENQRESEANLDRSVLMPKSDYQTVGEKRGSAESGYEQQRSPRKRVKMRDLESVCRSDGLDSDASHAEKIGKKTFPGVADSPPRPLDLNTEMCIPKEKVHDDSQECSKSSDKREQYTEFVTSRGIGLDLNSEDVFSSMNQDPFFPYKSHSQSKPRDISECASSTGPLEENDPMRVWKEMKQNGFLSSTHGGVPIPKQRGRKSKSDVLKKKMEIAKREQVDRFTKIAAPSGLLNELNPGIINHVRNRKQVHSIIEALVRSERHESNQVGNKQTSHTKSGTTEICNRKDQENLNDSAIQGVSSSHEDRPPNTVSWVRQVRGYPPSLIKCPVILEGKGVEIDQTTIERFSLKTGASESTLVNEEDALALKLSSSTKTSENESSLSNEDSASYLSVKAATVASQWLELLQQDIKGRLSALRRSKKRVRAVISTELPFLLSKEFSYDQENDPYAMKTSADGFSNRATAEMHRARWSRLFDQMDKSLSEEEKQLESWLNQVKEMQMHCEQGLQHMHWNTPFGIQHLGTSDSDFRSQKMDSSERELAVRAAAASIYSTCNFLLTENISCF